MSSAVGEYILGSVVLCFFVGTTVWADAFARRTLLIQSRLWRLDPGPGLNRWVEWVVRLVGLAGIGLSTAYLATR